MSPPRARATLSRMPIDTLLVYVGVYGDVADAEADYQLEQAMARAAKLEQKRIEADLAELERDAASVEQKIY